MNKTELKETRLKSKMTQAEFAKVIGVTANTIWCWENGQGAPRGGWNNASFKNKIEKLRNGSLVLAKKPVKKLPVSTQTEQTVDSKQEPKPIKIRRLIESLSSVLLDRTRLDQTQKLLVDAHAEGLTLVRLLELLGVMIASGPGCASLSHPNLADGWGCCSCALAHPDGMGTYNMNERTTCRQCGHKRCTR